MSFRDDNGRTIGTRQPLGLLVFLIAWTAASTPIRGAIIGQLGQATVSACAVDFPHTGCVDDATIFGVPLTAVAPNVGDTIAHSYAAANPSQNANFAIVAAGLTQQPDGSLSEGGFAEAHGIVLYILVNKITHQQVSNQSVTMRVTATASAASPCRGAVCGNTYGAWGVSISDYQSRILEVSMGGQANSVGPDHFGITTDLGVSFSTTFPQFNDFVHFKSASPAFYMDAGARAELLGAAAVDPTFTADDPNVEVDSLALPNPNPGASLLTPDQVDTLTAQGLDLSSFESLGLVTASATVPEPANMPLAGIVLGLIILIRSARQGRAQP